MHLDGCFWGQILFWKHSCVAADSFLKHIFILEILTQILRFLLCCHVQGERIFMIFFKVSEYPFKPNKNVLKNMTVLLYTYFYNISLNVLRPTFFNIYNLTFLRSPNIGKQGSKLGQELLLFPTLWAPAPTELKFSTIFFHWYVANQKANKTVPAIFFFSNIFWTIYF